MIVPLFGTRVLLMMLASLEHPVIIEVVTHQLLHTNHVSYQRACGMSEDIRREHQIHSEVAQA